MKSKFFSVWTGLIENFLKDISTDEITYNDLSTWMDMDGAKIFLVAQAEYFERKIQARCRDLSSPS